MPRPRDPKRDEAFRLWEESGGTRVPRSPTDTRSSAVGGGLNDGKRF
ncbi:MULTISPECIES: phage terminase small subunit-related protein [Bacillus]|nr:phage terminase small subunit-related protein [Bacillus subtilis]CJS85011.1 Phage terminase small subunit [Streptococcus pneumoniae]HWO75893.1 phage terminase small subunit-related protein [Bacillus sp. (in: firmicutes)]AWX20966.1 hypothetical protein CXF51_01440 [Bacillus subtilis subsp. subtilis]MCA1174816.1 hypothetical protein [Bacillus subtilis]MCB7163229.1 hypothetical protein [Bacillus subtilis]